MVGPVFADLAMESRCLAAPDHGMDVPVLAERVSRQDSGLFAVCSTTAMKSLLFAFPSR